MTDYTKTVNFAAKDTLPSGDTGKIIRGSEFETEFDNISTAIATKADLESPTFTGTVTIPTLSADTATIPTLSVDTVTFTTDIASNVIPSADNTYDLGSSSAEWKDLYIDGTAYIDTLRPSFIRINDSPNKLSFGDDDDFEIYHEPDAGGFIDCTLDGSNIYNRALYIIAEPLEVEHGSAGKVFNTTSTGITVTGLSLGDNEKAQFGGSNDLQIYHNGSNSFIEDAGTGNLNIKSNGNGVVIKDGSDNNLIAGLHATGEAKLWHVSGGTATERLITTGTGVRVNGEFTLNNDGTDIYATSSAFASASPFVDVKSDESSGTASTTVAVIRGPGTTSAAVARTAGIALKISNETSTTESKKGYDIYTTSSSTFGNNPSFHIDYADGTKRFSAADSGESYLYYNDSEKLATSTGGVSVTGVTDTDQLRVTTPTVPSSASDTGTAGDIAWDSTHIYICVATNTWKRADIATWS